MRPAVLVVTHRVPCPPDKGDRIRTHNIIRWLSERADVHLIALADEAVSDDSRATLDQLCARVELIPVSQRVQRLSAAWSLVRGGSASVGAFDVVRLRAVVDRWKQDTPFLAALVSSSALAASMRGAGPSGGLPVIADLMDVDSQKWADYARATRGPMAWIHGLEARRLRTVERDLTSWVRALCFVSEAEAHLFRATVSASGTVRAVANGVDLDGFRPGSAVGPSGCVFVGALDYRPNVDAVVWFRNSVWPEVRRRCPSATLRLVGRRPTRAVRSLVGQGVELAGDVADVRPFLGDAAVAIAPLRIARGVQNKVLEAMAMTRPVVVSPEATAGLKAEDGVHLVVARSPEAWVRELVSLLDDPERRIELGRQARRFVEEHHRWERCLEPFGSLLGLVPDTPAPGSTNPPHPVNLFRSVP